MQYVPYDAYFTVSFFAVLYVSPYRWLQCHTTHISPCRFLQCYVFHRVVGCSAVCFTVSLVGAIYFTVSLVAVLCIRCSVCSSFDGDVSCVDEPPAPTNCTHCFDLPQNEPIFKDKETGLILEDYAKDAMSDDVTAAANADDTVPLLRHCHTYDHCAIYRVYNTNGKYLLM